LSLRYEFDEFSVLPEHRQVLKNSVLVSLGARAFDLLICLMERRDRVVGKIELLEKAWPDVVVTENNLNAQVMALRRLFGPGVIITVAGRGFQFGPPVITYGVPAAIGVDRRQRKFRRGQAATEGVVSLVADVVLHDKPAIAVLPFFNMDAGLPVNIADGITEDLTTELTRFRSLFVIARNSALTFKGQAVDVRSVARQLGVQYVLEGSVRHSGPRIRVTANLIDALTGNHLWAEKYDRLVTDAFKIQEDLTMSILSAMTPQIAASEDIKVRRARTVGLNAYGLAQLSAAIQHSHCLCWDRVAFDEALRLARKAVSIDPSSAFSWRVLAGAQWLQIYFNFSPSAKDALAEALDASKRAITLDVADHFAHTTNGLVSMLAGQSGAGLLALRRARELNPYDANTLVWLAFYEATVGDASRAEQYGLDALSRSPCHPMRPGFLLLMSGVYFSAAVYATGLQYAHLSMQESPSAAGPRVAMAINWVGLGDVVAAKAAYEQASLLAPKLVEARLAGIWPSPGSSYHQRANLFFRIAAGLEEVGTTRAMPSTL